MGSLIFDNSKFQFQYQENATLMLVDRTQKHSSNNQDLGFIFAPGSIKINMRNQNSRTSGTS